MHQKLRSIRGTTLMEVLVATALLALLATGISAGVSSAAPIMKKSLELSANELLLDTLSNAVQGELRYASQITVTDPAPTPIAFEYFSMRYGQRSTLKAVELEPTAIGNQRLVVQSEGGTYYLIGDKAYGDAKLKECTLTLDAATLTFQVELKVQGKSGIVTTRNFSVYPFI